MAAENVETKLATDYETIRRREYELITKLLEILPKVDNLPEERLVQVRDALFHADHPFLMVFVGPFSSGKSSIINALLGQSDLLPVGPVPTTDRISILRWGEEPQQMSSGSDVQTVFHPSPLLRKVSFVDTPGLESVFQKHEDTTRNFLHRSDVVLMVMLATQAMTGRNMEYLQTLREFGKKVILVINQADLLTPEEAESVRNYVLEQSQSRLGYRPEVWLVSARKGMEARTGDTIDPVIWGESGLHKIEAYVDDQLSDVARLRQKLQTPLQITQNVSQAALTAVRANTAALDQYQSIADNVEQQLAAQKRDQDKIIREMNAEIEGKFATTALRGGEALREIFQFSRALSSMGRGVLELVGIAGLLRRGDGSGYVRAAFEQYKVFEPIAELPNVVDKLVPRLEGKDMQDMDDLVKYARREVEALPPSIREGVTLGNLQVPMQYDREALQKVRPDLEAIENEARTVETRKLEQTLRNTLLYLAVWEILLLVIAIFILAVPGGIIAEQPQSDLIALIALVVLGVLGPAVVALRGRFLQSAYTNRMLKLQARYIDTLSKATDKQMAFGMQLRQDAIGPLTRLIEAQTHIQKEQLNELQAAEQEMVSIETALTTLGKKSLLGLRG